MPIKIINPNISRTMFNVRPAGFDVNDLRRSCSLADARSGRVSTLADLPLAETLSKPLQRSVETSAEEISPTEVLMKQARECSCNKQVKTSSETQCKITFVAIMLSALLASTGWARNLNHNGDFDGDGVMDPTVYCEATGEWRILQSNSDYELLNFYWGGPGWTAIQSDYDGDGQADFVLYNRSTGEWGTVLSSNGYQMSICITFGGEGWTPITGDYDGDFLTDPTIYREATGEWRTKLSKYNHQVTSCIFGGPGCTAVSGDYDGDGMSDPGVYRRADGQWLISLSSHGYSLASYYVDTLGDGPLVPVPADYDGDGKTDPAMYAYSAPSHLNKYYVFAWHLLYSSQNYKQIEPVYQLGREDCKPNNADPAPGDYDGDYRADYGVSWPDTTMWRMWCSRNNYESHDDSDWGGLGFRPVQH